MGGTWILSVTWLSTTVYWRSIQGTVASHYTYNNRGMVTAEQLLHGTVNWTTQHTYPALGDLAATTYPDGHVVGFQPNALGQQTKAGTYASSATYHPNGMLQGFTYGNQVVHSRTLNARQLPDTILETKGSTQILNDAYDYDFNGNVAAISDGIAPHLGDRTMTYDPLDRLIEVQAGAAQGGNDVFVYDPLDNLRIRDNTDDGSWTEYRYDSDRNLPGSFYDMFTDSEGITGVKIRPGPTHDSRGNMTNRGYPYSSAEAFTYDLANRLISTNSRTYSYDGLGRRVKSVEGFNGTKNFYYSKSGQLLYSQRVNNGELLNYVYLDGRLVATRQVGGSSPGVTYAHTDVLGSPVAETNVSGTVTRRERFKAYGEPADGNVNTSLGFTGQYSDNNDLVYMQQRYYDPAMGRFLSVDPVQANPVNGANFNRYSYANNNPFRFVDPDGRNAVPRLDCRECENAANQAATVSHAMQSGDHETAARAMRGQSPKSGGPPRSLSDGRGVDVTSVLLGNDNSVRATGVAALGVGVQGDKELGEGKDKISIVTPAAGTSATATVNALTLRYNFQNSGDAQASVTAGGGKIRGGVFAAAAEVGIEFSSAGVQIEIRAGVGGGASIAIFGVGMESGD